MHRLWQTVVEPMLRAAAPKVIVEIGSADGAQTERLLEIAQREDGIVHVVDPAPDLETTEWEKLHGSRFVFHGEASLDALPRIESPDVVLIDGDHNWHTVINELRLIERGAADQGRVPPLVLAHDVAWPYGRRDSYWDPDAIPEQDRQPHERLGVVPGAERPVESGGLNRHLRNAIYEGTPRNGVLTALEDFCAESELTFELTVIDGLHGIGILASESLLEAKPAVAEQIAAFGGAPFLRAQNELVEGSRLQLAVRLEEAAAKLDGLGRRRQQLEQELSDRRTDELEQRVGTDALQQRIGSLLEELEIAKGAAQRLHAELERADERERELTGRLEAMRAELTSGRGLTGSHDPAGEGPDGEAELRLSFEQRYRFAADRFAELGEDGATGFALAQDANGILRPAAGENSGEASVDVVVCVHNAPDDVRRCLRSLLAAGGRPFHLILVDDGSDGPARRLLEWFAGRHPAVELVRNDDPPHGYTLAANLGLRASSADYVVLLNSDTVVTPGWLDALVELWESDDEIAVVGPLSNAATHQSVPSVKEDGGWALNPLPSWLPADALGFLVDGMSDGRLPRVPFVNGFCFGISRRAIEAVGLFDEGTFAEGFCEENDYAVRVLDAGLSLAVSDRAYVHHAKSRSYGSERRERIAKEHYARFLEKHGKQRVESLLGRFDEVDRELAPLRQRLAEATSDPGALERTWRSVDPEPLEVAYVLPGLAKGGGGGSHSVYQEVVALRALGVPARVLVPQTHMKRAAETYEDAERVFSGYASDTHLAELAAACDVIVSTHFRSIQAVEGMLKERRDFLPAYYVQDYEPFFAAGASAGADEALLSYGGIPDQLVFAKTHWLCSILAAQHGIQAAKVEPSLDTQVFNRRGRPEEEPGRPLRIAAMVRPRTPRRQPLTTVRLLDRAQRDLSGAVETVTFGCSTEELGALTAGGPASQVQHRGLLSRKQVAALLRQTDVFVDLSTYQAFGRTGLEAMACGCTALLPAIGGAGEYARDGVNSLLVESGDPQGCLSALAALARDRDRVRRMQAAAMETAGRYSALGAALSEYVLFAAAHRRRFGPRAQPARSGAGAA